MKIRLKIRIVDFSVTGLYNKNALYDGRRTVNRLRRREVLAIGEQMKSTGVGKRTYSVDEIHEILGISRRKAYELCHSGCFKVIYVGRVLRISKASFDAWLDDFET